MVLRNYVELVTGRPSRMHFTGGQIVAKTITDPLLGQPKSINVLALTVDELDGQPASAVYSVTAEKLASQLHNYVLRGNLNEFDFIITAIGDGFSRSYSVEPIRRSR